MKLIEYPADTVKVRLQTEPGRFGSAWHCLRQMLQEGSVMRLYQVLRRMNGGMMELTTSLFAAAGRGGADLRCNPRERDWFLFVFSRLSGP